jgi:ABC-type polysaccharide/polyol phosphate export permease
MSLFKEFSLLKSKNYFLLPFYLAIISLYRGHRGSFLGWLWLIIKPVIQISIYSYIFPLITRFDQKNYAFFLVCGILPWTFISISIIECANSLISRADVLKRSLLPRTVFPLADVIKNLILFFVSFIVIYIICAFTLSIPTSSILLLPLSLIPMLIFTLSCSVAISFLTPYFRDLSEIVAILFNILFLLTPILYPIDSIPPHMSKWFKLNPIYWMIEPVKEVTYYNTPSITTWLISSTISIIFMGISFIIYRMCRKNLVFYL